jgi:hypothetical protein
MPVGQVQLQVPLSRCTMAPERQTQSVQLEESGVHAVPSG